MTNPTENEHLAALAQRSNTGQRIQRGLVTIVVVTLAALGWWPWAWLVLALAALNLFLDIGFALVVVQVIQAITTIQRR